MAEFGSTIVDGIGRLDKSTEAAINSGIVAPAQNAVEIGFGPQGIAMAVLDNVALLIPRIADKNPEFAAAFQNALVDPLTGLERPFHDQIQRLYDIFVSMGEAGKPMVAAMDAGLNGVPDVLEQNIETPVEQTRSQLNEDFNGIVADAGTGATGAASGWRTGWLTGWGGFNPSTPISEQLKTIPPTASAIGGESAGKFTSGWMTGWGGWNPAGDVKPQLDAVPPVAAEAGGATAWAWRNAAGVMPADTGVIVTETADEFAGLKTAIQSEADLIAIAIEAIGAAFTRLRDYINGAEGVGGIDFAIIATNLTAQIPIITTAITGVTDAIALGLGQILIVWTNHFNALNTFIPLKLADTAVIFTNYMPLIGSAVTLGLGNIMLGWANHFAALNTFIPVQLGLTSQVFIQYMALVRDAVILGLGNVMLAWVNHFTALQGYVNQTFPAVIGIFNTWMALAASQVLLQTSQMSAHWVTHATSIGGTINNMIVGTHMANLARNYVALDTGVSGSLTNMSATWVTHASSIQSSVNVAVGHMADFARDYMALQRGVHGVLEAMNQYWSAHARHLGNQANAAAHHIDALARSISSSMSSIVSSMNRAKSMADALKRSIDALKSKSITVTTNYKTTGTKPGAARGFNGVVNRPQDIHVGEGGRPEMVSITPLQGTAGAHHNGLAAMRAAGGAGGGTTVNIGAGNMTMAAAKDDVTNYRRHVEREIDLATAAWDDYRNDVKRYLARVNTFLEESAGQAQRFANNVGGALGGGVGGGGGTGGGGGGGAGTGGGGTGGGRPPIPAPPTTPRKWLFEDTVDDWANSYGYNLKSYDPISQNKLNFKLSPERDNFKYIWEDTAADWLQKHSWRFAQGGYNVIGNGKKRSHTLDMTVQAAAKGMHETVKKPTMILAGEAGRAERVDITPRGRGGAAGQAIQNYIIIDGMEMKRWIRKVSNEGYSAMR